jgi:PAS domain S-box-containing protein
MALESDPSAESPAVAENPFDRVTALANTLFRTPISAVSLVDGECYALSSARGTVQMAGSTSDTFSKHVLALGTDAVLVIEDTLEDPRTRDNPYVLGPPNARFYVGATITSADGRNLGTVAVADVVSRDRPSDEALESLRMLARIAGDICEQMEIASQQRENLETLRLAEVMAGVGHFRFDVRTGQVSWSDEVFRIHGLEPGAVDPTLHSAIGAYHPDDAEVMRRLVNRALATGEGYDAELRLTRADGEARVTRAKAHCERDETGTVTALFGVFQDITDSVRVHEQVARSEALFRLMSETSTDIIARFDIAGRFLYLSPATMDILGRHPDDMLGKDCSDFIPEDDLKTIRATLRAYVAAGPGAIPPRYEYRAIRADGSTVWLEATPRAIRDDSGRVVEFHDHVRDITARKIAERAQAETVETLKLAESMSGVGHWRLDLIGGEVTWSNEIYRIFGYEPGAIDPTAFFNAGPFHPEDNAELMRLIEQSAETGEGYECQLRFTRHDGDERTTTAKAACQFDHYGRQVALFGVFQDVTERTSIVAAISASEARYRLLADNATDIIATYGMDGVFRYISPAIEGPMGFRPEELIGRPFWKFMHPDDVRAVRAAFSAYAKAGPGAPSPRVAYRGVRKDGQTVWLEAHPKVIRDAEGRALEFQDVVRDVSETKALEDQLIASRDVAEAGARAKSEFLANMSHELRTPLTSVIGFSGLLQASQTMPEAERKYADRIATASEALLSVINDILDYSKLEADAVDLDPQAFDPRAMAEGAVAIVETQCQTKGLTLETVMDADLPGGLVGDEGRLRQVTLNFLSNAVKFTASGTVRLELAVVGDRLRLAVTDSGIGIAPDKIEALFDRFTQADASTTRVYGGTGLGLAISRRLIEMMGGEIGADSRPGEGSTFWFEVPMHEAVAGVEAEGSGDRAVDAGLKILMADDAAPNRELVTAILGGLGLALETVCNGAEAVEAARNGAYDLILMDVHMPVMDGLDATRAIRAMGGAAGQTPIIALTANVQPEQVLRCREAGMDGHVGKPIQVGELLTALASASVRAAAGEADAEPVRSART